MLNSKAPALAGLILGLAYNAAVSAAYLQVNLVSDDGSVPGTLTDPDLVNPWGISSSATGPFWVSDNATGKSTLYSDGVKLGLVVTIPPQLGSPSGTLGTPTGQVFNSTSGFELTPGNKAQFLFATEDGTISGWNSGTTAVLKVSTTGVVYKGLALATSGGNPFLYAANFAQGRIDVFDGGFGPASLPGAFTDPSLPAGYAPFNIQNLGGSLYVTYAQQSATDPGEEEPGPGLGIVDVYTPEGLFIRRVATSGALDAPWGLALAPPDFGEFSNALLVGNFGDGRITAFDPTTDAVLGQLTDPGGQPIAIEGLWGLAFGNDGSAGNSNELFFAAGIGGEEHGLFGKLEAVPEPAPLALIAAALAGMGWMRRRKAELTSG